MAEERIIDEEYGRGVRMKKTKDGYVDVTDELAEEGETVEGEGSAEEASDEMTFEFPEMEEDDEDLVGLSPEEAMALRQKKEEEARRKKEEYEKLVAEGEALLTEGSFKSAELKFERALQLDRIATAASVGYWRAKTEDFKNPDVLIEEYVESGYENLEFDLGYEAVEIIKKNFSAQFKKRYDELTEEETPLKAQVEEMQQRRRAVLKPRLKKTGIAFACGCVALLLAAFFTVMFGLRNFTVRDDRYILPTIIAAAVTAVVFIVFGVLTNRFINAGRIYRQNERLSTTEEGARLEEIGEYKELYSHFI